MSSETLIKKYDELIAQLEEELKKAEMPPPKPIMHAESQVKTPSSVPVPKEILAHLESNNHQQRDHPVVNTGVNKGTQAISSYGLMPIDVLETAQKHKPFKESDIGKKILDAKSLKDINNITQDQNKDDEILNHVWNYKQSRLIANHVVTPEQLELMGVMAHRRGITGALKAFNEGGLDAVKNDPYVKKYIQIKNTKQVAGL